MKVKLQWTKNIYLTKDELLKILERMTFGEMKHWVMELDEYLTKNPKKSYKSHYRTILNWYVRSITNPRYVVEHETPKDIY